MVKNRTGKAPSQRQLRVGEQLRSAISDMLLRGDLYEPELNNTTIVVSQATVSPDLRNALIYVVPMGLKTSDNVDSIIAVLNRNANKFKHYVAKNIDLRYHPSITFKFDSSFDYAQEISSLLNKTKIPTKINDGQE